MYIVKKINVVMVPQKVQQIQITENNNMNQILIEKKSRRREDEEKNDTEGWHEY